MTEHGPPAGSQARANAGRWSRGDFVGAYASRDLRPVEVMLLVRYREALSGRVLELGCGAGRLTGYLVELAESVDALDISAAMVEHCRERYPQARAREGDLRDLSAYEPGSFDVVVAPFNVLDVFDDEERQRVLDEIHERVVADGLLILSSHNHAFAPSIRRPTDVRTSDPIRLAVDLMRVPRRVRNRRRLAALQRVEEDYGIFNDDAHDFTLLHYYISRDAQARQLAEHGFELEDCLDLDGRPVPAGESAPGCPELHYVARRR